MILKNKISFYLLTLLLFLLPWQTRYIYDVQTLGGSFWEYGSRGLYATEMLLGMVMLVFLIEKLSDSRVRAMLRSSGGTKKTKLRLLTFGVLMLCAGYVAGTSAVPEVVRNKFHYIILAICLGFLIFAYPDFPVAENRGSSISANRNRDRVFFILSLWAGGVVQGALALWQFLIQEVVHLPFSGIAPQVARTLGTFVIEFGDERWLRAYGSFGSPNILGGFLAVVWVLGLKLYFEMQDGWKKILIMIGQLVVLVGLLVSFSRGAWIAAALGLVACIGVLVQKNMWGEKKSEVVRAVLYSAVVVGVIFFVYKPLFVTRVSGAGRLEVKSNQTRLNEFGDWWQIVKTKPVLGTGPGLYTYELSQVKPGVPGYKYQPIHNTFLLFVAEWGVVGVVVWLGVLWQVGLFKRREVFLPLVVVFIITAGLDHYYWSLSTGMFLAAVIFAFILAKKEEV